MPRPARLWTSALLGAIPVLAGSELTAQVQVRLAPSAGLFVPTSLLYETDYSPGVINPARAELGRAPIVGLGLHALPTRALFSVRVALQRVISLETTVTGRDPLVGVPEEAWPTHEFTVPTTITTLTGDLLLHPDRGEFRTDPYLFVGFGWKRYTFGDAEPVDEVGFDFPEDGSSGRIHYGAGMELRLGPLPIAAEVAGNFNRFVLVDAEQGLSRSRSQHEFAITVHGFVPLLSF